MNLREEIREWLIDAKYGVIDGAELNVRIDGAIERLEEPPGFLIALASGESVAFEDRLDLVRDRLTNHDFGKLAVRLRAELDSGRMEAEEIAAVAARIKYDQRADETCSQFSIIDTAFDLYDQGVTDAVSMQAAVIDALNKAARFAGAPAAS